MTFLKNKPYLSITEKHYKDLSEIWHHHYDDQTQISQSLMILQGILVEMHSDMIQFEIKNGSDKTEKPKARLELITHHINNISRIQADNYSLKHHNKKLIERNMYLEQKIAEYEKQEKEGDNL